MWVDAPSRLISLLALVSILGCSLGGLGCSLGGLGCSRGGESAEREAGSANAPAREHRPVEASAPLPARKLIPNREGDPLPPAKVIAELPDPPAANSLVGPDVPLRYEDGAYSIQGLRKDFDAQLGAGEAGEDVELRAWVQRLYTPPPGCERLHCRQAHLWVVDGPEAKGRRLELLVGPYAFDLSEREARRWALEPDVVLEQGKQYLFKGKFRRWSDTGFFDERGLLQFTAYREDKAGAAWIYPKGADWHPKMVAEYAAQEAALLERMREDAEALERERHNER